MDTLSLLIAQDGLAAPDAAAESGVATGSGGIDGAAVDGVGDAAGGGIPDAETLLQSLDLLHDPNAVLMDLAAEGFVWPTVLAVLGLLCILNGYRWHRPLVALLAFILGIVLGKELASEMGRPMLFGLSIGLLFAVVATPLLRLSVALLAGATGAFIGANAYQSAVQATMMPNYFQAGQEWVGAAIGFVALAMLSLMLFRFCVVLFTSVGGAGMLVFGVIALLMLVEDWQTSVLDTLSETPLVPTLTLLAAVGGFIVQHHRLREEGVKLFAAEG